VRRLVGVGAVVVEEDFGARAALGEGDDGQVHGFVVRAPARHAQAGEAFAVG
jgi:hypothetical protein